VISVWLAKAKIFGQVLGVNNESQKKPLISPSAKVQSPGTRFEGKEAMRELFEGLGLQYIERTLFSRECAIFLNTEKTDYEEYNKDTELAEANIAKYQHLVQKGYMAPVYVKWMSDEVGYGLFASEDISAGSLIGEYAGVVTQKDQVHDRTWSWKYPIKGKFIDSLFQGTSLNGGEFGNELRFINHSDDRNTSPVFVYDGETWVNCYYARKPIAKDQELTVNYGKRYWKTRMKVDL